MNENLLKIDKSSEVLRALATAKGLLEEQAKKMDSEEGRVDDAPADYDSVIDHVNEAIEILLLWRTENDNSLE